MKPERMIWCEIAVPWVLDLARQGSKEIPEHPLTRIDRFLGDDIEGDLTELKKWGMWDDGNALERIADPPE